MSTSLSSVKLLQKQPAVEKKRTKDVDSPTMNVAFGKLI